MSSQKIIMFQTGIIKLCTIAQGGGTEDLEIRIAKIEQALKNGVVPTKSTQNTSQTPKSESIKKSEKKPEEKKKEEIPSGPIETNWTNIVNNFKSSGKIMLYTNLINTVAKEINDMTVGIEFPNGITPFGKTVLEKSENINEIEKQVSIVCGKEMRVKFIDTKKEKADTIGNAENNIEAFAKNADLSFNIIDE